MPVTDDRWPRVKALFQAAVEQPIEERGAFLAAATGDDEALRREVESLLSSDTPDAGFLDQLPVATESLLADCSAAPVTSDHPLPVTGLTSGVRVGPYEIAVLLGAGAMGEVYRACDTTLNREVALKVLPERFALDPDRLARFTREAHLLATLNHPNIAAIYGREESSSSTGSGHAAVHAIVMELVEGEDLTHRIARGAIPIDEALPIARQIAGALEAAHEKGIIHRDVKPANIKIARNGVVKVLDFGLAKVWDGAPQADLSGSPRLTATAIVGRAILGTPSYMSPEQARGQSLDRRTDIWSFGCVLCEMLTGRAPFAGATISDTLAAILEHEPDWTMLPADTPMPIRRLLRRCLQKDRTERLDSAADARLEIDDAIAPAAAETLAPAGAPLHRVTPGAIAVLAGGMAIAALVAWALMRPAPAAPILPSRFAIATPPAHPLNVSGSDRDLALSPDGRHLVYRAGGSVSAGGPLLVRAIGELDARSLVGITHAYAPFFSPDGQWIGFFERAELKKVAITGGPAITLGPFTGASLGASWGEDDMIVFGTDDPNTGLWRVPAAGGRPTSLTTNDAAPRPNDHGFPSVLPGGRGVLFTITAAGRANNTQVVVLDPRTGQRKTLVHGGSQAEYVDVSTTSRLVPFAGAEPGGYLIYAATGALRAVRFDPDRLEVIGDPVTVVDDVMTKVSGGANYVVSRSGTLVYVPGGAAAQAPMRSLVWVDRKGHEQPTGAPLRSYGPPRLSPDGTRVAVGILDQGNTEIWILDLARDTMRRLTFSPGMDGIPHWTRDGRRIVFMSARAGVPNVFVQSADETGTVDRLMTSANSQWPTAITPDGTAVVGFEMWPGTGDGTGVILLPLASPASRAGAGVSPSRVAPIGKSLFDGEHADISPDGRYLAYQAASESGRKEVYVRPFPHVDRGRWQISTRGGTRPAWARSGRELFYIDDSMTLIRVPVRTSGSTLSMGSPAKVFDTTYAQPNPARHFDVSPDGQRFLMVKNSPDGDPNATPASMVVVEHWFEDLKQRVRRNRQ